MFKLIFKVVDYFAWFWITGILILCLIFKLSGQFSLGERFIIAHNAVPSMVWLYMIHLVRKLGIL